MWNNVAQISTSFHSSFPLETTNKTGQRKHPDNVFSILFSQKQSAFLCLCCCCSHPPNESLMKEVPLLLCQVCKCSKELATALFWAWAERNLPLPLLRALLLLLFHPRCKNEVMWTWLSSILITNMNNNFFTLLNNVKSSEVCVVKLLLPELCQCFRPIFSTFSPAYICHTSLATRNYNLFPSREQAKHLGKRRENCTHGVCVPASIFCPDAEAQYFATQALKN